MQDVRDYFSKGRVFSEMEVKVIPIFYWNFDGSEITFPRRDNLPPLLTVEDILVLRSELQQGTAEVDAELPEAGHRFCQVTGIDTDSHGLSRYGFESVELGAWIAVD